MKLATNWGGKSQKPKASGPSPKTRWDLLGIADPRKGSDPKSIEEIRKQAQIISCDGFRQSVPTTPTVEKTKKVTLAKPKKPVKKPVKKSKKGTTDS